MADHPSPGAKLAFIQEMKRNGEERSVAQREFNRRYPGHNDYDFSAMWHMGGSSIEKEKKSRPVLELPAPSVQDGLFRIPELALPVGATHGDHLTCLIPAELARLSWMFGVKAKPSRSFATSDTLVSIGAGAESDPERSAWALTTYHSRVLFSLFYRLQVLHFPFRHVGTNKEFLELDISPFGIHKTMNPDSAYGSDSRERIKNALTQMVECPIRCESLSSGATYATSLLHSVHPAPCGKKLRIRVSAHYSGAFIRARGKAGKRDQVKPLLFGIYRSIRAPYARPLYLHLDWTLSSHHKSELRLEEVIRRAGSALGDGTHKKSLKYSSQRRSRLAIAIAELEGLPLSLKGDAKIHLHEARVASSATRTLLKLVASKQRYHQKGNGDLSQAQYLSSITEIPYFEKRLKAAQARSRDTGPPLLAA